MHFQAFAADSKIAPGVIIRFTEGGAEGDRPTKPGAGDTFAIQLADCTVLRGAVNESRRSKIKINTLTGKWTLTPWKEGDPAFAMQLATRVIQDWVVREEG